MRLFETGPHVAQVTLSLLYRQRCAWCLVFWSSRVHFPNAEITDMCHSASARRDLTLSLECLLVISECPLPCWARGWKISLQRPCLKLSGLPLLHSVSMLAHPFPEPLGENKQLLVNSLSFCLSGLPGRGFWSSLPGLCEGSESLVPRA